VREERAAAGEPLEQAALRERAGGAPRASADAAEVGAPARGRSKPKAKPKPKGPSKNRISAQERAEQEVEQAEADLATLEQELADPAAWATRYEAAKSEARHTAARRAVEAAYARLEELID
jgi:ATP-binding cassette subfamily F protein 3